MPFTNPFTNAPRLPSPIKRPASSRPASRSPVRNHAQNNDPLLRDLSPSSTLRAFVSDPTEWTESTSHALARSILSSSASERALGAKAAQICLDVRAWTREMEQWPWPGAFDVPTSAERTNRTSMLSLGTTMSSAPSREEEEDDDRANEVEYWGSLPASTVQAYGRRADEISQALDVIDVEELKTFVLSSHYRTDSNTAGRAKHAHLKRLDDYTAVVTATILQALPYLSRLNQLLDLWTLRLIILQGAPVFLRDLKRARLDMDHGWAAIAVSPAFMTGPASASFSRETMLEMKLLIESQVQSLGRRLDRFLDDLEGRDETVPDSWIDDFERLESAYGDWVVQAERRVLENEWRDIGEKTTMTRASGANTAFSGLNGQESVSHSENPESDDDVVVDLPVDRITEAAAPANAEPLVDMDALEQYQPIADGSGNNADDGKQGSWQADMLLPRISVAEERRSANLVASIASSNPVPTTSEYSSTEKGSNQTVNTSSADSAPAKLPKTRTAFLDTADRNSTLIKSKSPVRPFEHASNAFTRLFKKDRGAEQDRLGVSRSKSSKISSSVESSSSITVFTRKSRSPGRKSDTASNTETLRKHTDHDPPRLPTKTRAPAQSRSQSESSRPLAAPVLAPILMPPKDIERRKSAPPKNVGSVEESLALSSPFHSPDDAAFPEDWPLSTPVETPRNEQDIDPISRATRSKSEIYSPSTPIETETFDQMFVQNFSVTPLTRPGSARQARGPDRWAEVHKRAKSMPRIKGKSPVVVHKLHSAEQTMPEYTDFHNIPIPRPISLVAEETESLASEAHQTDSDRVQEAEIISSSSILDTSLSTSSRSAGEPVSEPAISSDDISLPVDTATSGGAAQRIDDGNVVMEDSEPDKQSQLKRASMTSVEAFKRADVKSIDVSAASKQVNRSSSGTPPRTPESSRPQTPESRPVVASPSTPGSLPGKHVIATPPRKSSIGKASISNGPDLVASRRRNTLPSSPPEDPAEHTPDGGRAPLNAAMSKRRGKGPQRSGHRSPNVLTLSPSKKGAIFNPEGDSFDRHISEVLERLPSSIRFKTRPGAETPVSMLGEPRSYGPSRSKAARGNPRHNVTIAPAESPPKKASSTSDNEVKVYHLTQAGSDETIKLFVRLVGESERVMVRVGGGWADLADYLRQYAEHHGSRTVSEGTSLEVQTVNGTTSRRTSGAAEQKGKQPVTPVANRAVGSEEQSWLNQPQPRFSMGDGTSSDENSAPAPKTYMTTSASSTPMSSATKGSRPSTANTERPASRQSASDVKLSGPSSAKRGQLSEHKEKWVEGMIERAKQASAEKAKEDNQKYFGELGRAGGTRRVIFRSSSAMSNRPNGSEKAK